MLLNEIINEVGMTKRAVKYYEEKGLLSVDKDNNGYRNYTAQDVETLKKISVYRKLGISIKDIQSLLETGDKSILLRIYQEKVQEKVLKDSELEALKQFIDDGDADKANEALDYQTVENAIESLLPGKEWGDYFKSHFKPFLNVRLKTLEQKQALQNILEYCDETTLKVPFIMGIGAKMIGGIAQETRTADEMIAYYRDMSESEYERLKEKVWKPMYLSIQQKETGKQIKKLLMENGYTVKDVQNAMGFENPQAIYKWISGRSLPSLDNFVILSRLLHTSIEDILVVDGDVVRLWGIIHDYRKSDCGFSMVLNRWYNDKASVMQ